MASEMWRWRPISALVRSPHPNGGDHAGGVRRLRNRLSGVQRETTMSTCSSISRPRWHWRSWSTPSRACPIAGCGRSSPTCDGTITTPTSCGQVRTSPAPSAGHRSVSCISTSNSRTARFRALLEPRRSSQRGPSPRPEVLSAGPRSGSRAIPNHQMTPAHHQSIGPTASDRILLCAHEPLIWVQAERRCNGPGGVRHARPGARNRKGASGVLLEAKGDHEFVA